MFVKICQTPFLSKTNLDRGVFGYYYIVYSEPDEIYIRSRNKYTKNAINSFSYNYLERKKRDKTNYASMCNGMNKNHYEASIGDQMERS